MPSTRQTGPHRPTTAAAAGTTCTVAGAHATLWLTAPTAAMVLTVPEAALAVTVVLTALYAPDRLSDRAFRLLPWASPASHRLPDPNTSGPPATGPE
ncbi:hypothetical protein ACFZBU_40450 [Embleya sp. NPDC008237]|uniref:hypothetical protein n=1 Tax=Embleya sp. NPDC008237 TaxID=3363978 RepID=UPI0036EC2BD0